MEQVKGKQMHFSVLGTAILPDIIVLTTYSRKIIYLRAISSAVADADYFYLIGAIVLILDVSQHTHTST